MQSVLALISNYLQNKPKQLWFNKFFRQFKKVNLNLHYFNIKGSYLVPLSSLPACAAFCSTGLSPRHSLWIQAQLKMAFSDLAKVWFLNHSHHLADNFMYISAAVGYVSFNTTIRVPSYKEHKVREMGWKKGRYNQRKPDTTWANQTQPEETRHIQRKPEKIRGNSINQKRSEETV